MQAIICSQIRLSSKSFAVTFILHQILFPIASFQINVSRKIDDYDFVFRLNNAPVRNYEQVVGSKTSFYGTYFSTLREAARNQRTDKADQYFYSMSLRREFLAPFYYLNFTAYQEFKEHFRTHELYHQDQKQGRIFKMMRKFYLSSQITFLSPRFGFALSRNLLRSDYVRTTSGLKGIAIAIALCPQPPDIAGFSLEGSKHPYHYYSSFKKSFLSKVHNGSLETNGIRQLFGCGFLGSDITYGILGWGQDPGRKPQAPILVQDSLWC